MMKHELARYDAYKDSGVNWLGEVPNHWDVKRLKETIIGGLSYGANESALNSNPLHPRYIRITDFSDDETLKDETYKSLEPDVAKSYLLREGDILFARSGATAGKTFHFKNYPGKACYAGYLIKARPKKTVLISNFLSYFTKSFVYGDWRNSIVIKATIENISAEKYGLFLFVPTPSISEQKSIADYLDTKTAQIDRKIDLLTQKATQYGKLKQSLINETVTRGLDKSVAMKDSGVEWIGEVPEHWVVNRLKDIFNERTDKGYPDEPLLIASQDKGVTLKASYSRHTMTVQKNFHTQKLVKKADFVISLRSFEGGIETAHYRGIISAAYTIMYPINEQGSGYYKHLFKSSKFISLLVTHTTGIREGRNINYQQLKRDVIPVPNPVERQKIASYLDTKTAHIDRIIETINTQIDKLKELRKTLINDVVTGKMKVAQ